MKYCLIIFFGLAVHLDAYVILQVRNGNSSDAAVNTVLHDSDVTKNQRLVGTRRAESDVIDDPAQWQVDRRSDFRLGVDTGARRYSDSGSGISKIIHLLSAAYDLYFKQPAARKSKSIEYDEGSETKRALAVELKSQSILRSVEDFLGSPKVKKAASELARKAAVIYRAVQSEL